MDSAPVLFDKKIIPEKKYSRCFELLSDKKNNYKISIYNQQDKLILSAINLNSIDIKSNEYNNEVLINELKKNKYLSLCESINDMLEELFNLIDNKKYTIKEEGNNEITLSIEVPMKLIKEITFNLIKKEKDTNLIINDLITENNELKSKIEVLSLQVTDLKDDINYLKNKNDENKINELYNKLSEKIDNLELKINHQNLDKQKEKNNLISQVNILTKKVLLLEENLEQEKINNKNNIDNINRSRTLNTNYNTNNRMNDEKESNNQPPINPSKSVSLPNLLFESFFGSLQDNPELGEKGRSKLHEHILVFSSYSMKDPCYSLGNYFCDHCRTEFSQKVNNFHCKNCHFDLCEKCFKLSKY